MFDVLAPGARLGILGGGQLGAMLASAASEIGFKPYIYAPEANSPAFQRTGRFMCEAYENAERLAEFARSVDVVTYEFENVPIDPLAAIETIVPIRPGVRALETAQDRLVEKQFLAAAAVPLAAFESVGSQDELVAAVQTIGFPCVLKTRRFGYDGKGQLILRSPEQLEGAFDQLGGGTCVLESFVPFFAETSLIAARGLDGTISSYEMALNSHESHILKTTELPSGLPAQILDQAKLFANSILSKLDYVGVMGIEFFVSGTPEEPELLVNEIAPRVHNSGHWTQDGALVDQFEQHIRAISGWPLGDGSRHSDVTMLNLIGDDVHNWQVYAANPNFRIHLYGKEEARPGRKMGHVNCLTKPV
ncbi:MAG: 5-(carboxyamino)imidazole ribonucleotide synthase [Hyphomicrobiales bacterium]|uniref:5-(carboxyamino)imidazole ribonucleotide synthase n=1 Tax=Nisaea sp. TaxID=2024842 RepID=UPI00327722ED